MPELIKSFIEVQPATRFIGKRYFDRDRNEYGSFSTKWGEWFDQDWFAPLLALLPTPFAFEHQRSNIGLMRTKEGEPFEYWIGIFCPANSVVPAGFEFIDFPKSTLGVTWIKGKEPEIYGIEHLCADQLKSQGIEITQDKKGATWFYERYVCPRFTQPDEQGNRILDLVFFTK